MRQHSVLLSLILAVNVLVTILTGSCAEDPVVNKDVRYQTLLDSDGNHDDAMQRGSVETFMEMAEEEGYSAEEHEVITEDGYILLMHRLPSSPKSPASHGKQPVLLIHGLLAASEMWVLRGREHDLAYLLADNGYDVWAVNLRGNYYSKRHKYMSAKEPKFWRFSFHEFGIWDVAASIDYIVALTGMPKVSLVGHSMGGTVELILLSIRPEYNDRVNVAVNFAPVAIVTHPMPGLLNTISIRYEKQIAEAMNRFGMFEVFPRDKVDLTYVASICQQPRIRSICIRVSANLFGLTNLEEFDSWMITRLVKHFPQGTSAETLKHFAQISITGKFTEYDFGTMSNYLRYKSFAPPEYPLEKITAPVALYYGPNDSYTTKKDVEALMKRIRRTISREVPYSNFGHLDFLFLNGARRLLYRDTLELLNGYRDTESNGLEDESVA